MLRFFKPRWLDETQSSIDKKRVERMRIHLRLFFYILPNKLNTGKCPCSARRRAWTSLCRHQLVCRRYRACTAKNRSSLTHGRWTSWGWACCRWLRCWWCNWNHQETFFFWFRWLYYSVLILRGDWIFVFKLMLDE